MGPVIMLFGVAINGGSTIYGWYMDGLQWNMLLKSIKIRMI